MSISVVVPIHNEEANIVELFGRLSDVLAGLDPDVDVIMVDDGSSDASWRIIGEIHARDARLKGIRFSRCFGHHVALTAGLDRATGGAVILMDGDLQDLPEEIPKLYERHLAGYDLVYAVRRQRQDPLVKRVNSRLFWWAINKVSGLHMPQNQTMLRVMSRRLVDAVVQMREQGRFLHGMMAWTGFEATEVLVVHGRRERGATKYSILKQLRLALFAITAFSVTPLRVASILGLAASGISFLAALYLLVLRFTRGYPVLGWASIIVSIFFVGGVQLFVLGIMGEYIGKTYQESQRRPLYVLRETLF
jgi:glycosyltransferase involved in cell wall biosynthesis